MILAFFKLLFGSTKELSVYDISIQSTNARTEFIYKRLCVIEQEYDTLYERMEIANLQTQELLKEVEACDNPTDYQRAQFTNRTNELNNQVNVILAKEKRLIIETQKHKRELS